MKRKQRGFLLGLLLLVSFLIRFWRLPDRAVFLGDQGRDLYLVREQLLTHRLPLTGPPTSQKINTGPAYFYLIAPFLLLTRFSPFGPIFFFTFLGVISSWLIFLLNQPLFGFWPAFFSAFAYALSGPVIERTLGFWNPVPVPFLLLLILWICFQIQVKKKIHWLPVLGFATGFTVQFHLAAYFILLPLTAWWLFLKVKQKPKQIGKWSAWGLFGFLLALSPFLLFQIHNQFVDFRQMILLLLSPGPDSKLPFAQQFLEFFSQQFFPLTFRPSLTLNIIFGLLLVFLPFRQRSDFGPRFWAGWLGFGLILLGFFPQTTHPHYACFIWPLPFLLLGPFLKKLQTFLPAKVFLAMAVLFLFFQTRYFFAHFATTHDLSRTQTATATVFQESLNQPFALVLLSTRSPSDAHLRYFLALKKAPLSAFNNPRVKLLFVVCESRCPTAKDLTAAPLLDTECLPDCPFLNEQKFINWQNWSWVKQINFPWGVIYVFEASEKR